MRNLIALIAVCLLASPCFANDKKPKPAKKPKVDKMEKVIKMQEKEKKHLQKMIDQYGAAEKFEKRFAKVKELAPKEYEATVAARAAAVKACQEAIQKVSVAKDNKELSEAKSLVNEAVANVMMAEAALKNAGWSAERKQMVEKAGGNAELAAISAKIDAQIKELAATKKATMELVAKHRALEKSTRELNTEFKKAYMKAVPKEKKEKKPKKEKPEAPAKE